MSVIGRTIRDTGCRSADEGRPPPGATWGLLRGLAVATRARQAIMQSKRWLADRRVVVVADSSFAADLDLQPVAILRRFVFRWRIDTTFQEVREHLGVETQRQWSDLAILRSTPALLGLYSLVALCAHGLMGEPDTAVRPYPAASYNKSLPTFSDAIATVRRVLWTPGDFPMSRHETETVEIPAQLLNRLVATLCLAA